MSNNSGWINGALEIVTTKAGKPMINIKKDLVLEKGQRILLEDFETSIAGLVTKGFLTQDEASERVAKLHFVKYVGTVAPMEKEDAKF